MANQWAEFEKSVLRDTRKLGHVIAQIPSAMKSVRGKTFRMKTDCDFAASINGKSVFFDAKTCEKDAFYFKSYVFDEKKVHQYNFLRDAESRGCEAGYLVFFTSVAKVVWIPIRAIDTAVALGIKGANEATTLTSHQPYDVPINLGKLIWG